MAGYELPNYNREIDIARKRGDQAGWAQLVGDRFAKSDLRAKQDALIEAHFAAETARDPRFREFAAAQAIAMDRAVHNDPVGRVLLAVLKSPGKSGRSHLQEALDAKARASGAVISPQHAVLALKMRGVIRQSQPPL